MTRARHCCVVGAAILLGGVGLTHAAPSARAVEAGAGARPDATQATATSNTAGAREHYTRAVELYDTGDHSAALTEFRRAYSLKPSYQLLFNIGQLELLLQHHAAARQSLEQYLREGGPRVTAERRADVLQQLDALAKKTTSAVPAGALEAAPMRPAPEASRETLDAAVVALPRVQPPSSNAITTAAWVSTGTLGLGALGTGIATLLTSRRYEQLRATPAAPSEAARARDELDRQRALVSDLATVTDVLAIAALASAGLSLYFTLSHGAANDAEGELSLELTPGGVTATGSF